jgi:hypothetical protein
MPRVVVPVTQITRAGIAPAAEVNGDATNNHYVSNTGDVFLLVRNANGASTARTLTVRYSKTIDGQAVSSRTYSIPAATSRYVGPFPLEHFSETLQVDVDNAELKLSAYRASS